MINSPSPNGTVPMPYAQPAVNALYNRLFCDRPADFAPPAGSKPTAWQAALFGDPVNSHAVSRWADEAKAESRVRLLACAVLQAAGQMPATRELLGVIVEVPLEDGLDVLAAYRDGSVRYINHTGKVEILEALPATRADVGRLFEAAAEVVSRIGAWDKPRLPAPRLGNIRLSFLVSDGLYFGEGPMQHMQRDGLAGPVIQHATALLQLAVGLATRQAA